MRAIAFTDLHLSAEALKSLRWKIRLFRPEILLCAGDVSLFGTELDDMLSEINNFNIKTLIIHGNHEDSSAFRKKCQKYRNLIFLHKEYYIHKNYVFFGYGGGGFSFVDKEFNPIGKKFIKIIQKNKDKKKIFLTHAPPYGTKVDDLGDHHCGNKTTRDFDTKNEIDLHLCGHLHENFGVKDQLGKTKILNPGPFGKLLFL